MVDSIKDGIDPELSHTLETADKLIKNNISVVSLHEITIVISKLRQWDKILHDRLQIIVDGEQS